MVAAVDFNSIFEEAYNKGGLSKMNEDLLRLAIRSMTMKEIPAAEINDICVFLREHAQDLQDHSWKELKKTVHDLRHLNLIEADSHLSQCLIDDFNAAQTKAQANRIENEYRKQVEKTNKALSTPVVPQEIPPFVFNDMPQIRDINLVIWA